MVLGVIAEQCLDWIDKCIFRSVAGNDLKSSFIFLHACVL